MGSVLCCGGFDGDGRMGLLYRRSVMAHTILRVSVANGDGDGREDGFAESEDRSLIG